MQTYLVEPLLGVGPVRIGMTREAVQQSMPEASQPFLKTRHAQHETDAFHGNAFQVFYTGDSPTVDYIELSKTPEIQVMFAGQSVFGTPAEELVEILGRENAHHSDDDFTPCDVLFPDLQMSLWRLTPPESPGEEEGRYFDTVGIGGPGYYKPRA